jgi:hypothetical protein
MPTRRRERNQELYREVNERIRALSTSFVLDEADVVDFVCECGDVGCTDQIGLSLAEYEGIPRTNAYFVVRPGHERGDQRVVRRRARYLVIAD